MKKTVFLITIVLALLMAATALAGPSQCLNCGQDNVFMVSCAGRLYRTQNHRACHKNYQCVAWDAYYQMVYTCPNCDWYVEADEHKHEECHSVCDDVFCCPFAESRGVMYYYPSTGTISSVLVDK